MDFGLGWALHVVGVAALYQEVCIVGAHRLSMHVRRGAAHCRLSSAIIGSNYLIWLLLDRSLLLLLLLL